MKLTIIIPAKNEEKTLPYLIDSIKKQTLKNVDIIVADANSKDKTKEIAINHGCKVVRGGYPDEGKNNGANEAIKNNADILVFIDADMILPSKCFLENALKEFNARKLDAAGTMQVPLSLNSKIKKNNVMKTCKKSKDLKYLFLYELTNMSMKISQNTKNPFLQNCIFAKKNVHKVIGGFKPLEFGEDSKYAKDVVEKGYKFGILEKPGKVFISTRRFEKKGFINMIFTYLYFNIGRLLGHEFLRGKSKRYFD